MSTKAKILIPVLLAAAGAGGGGYYYWRQQAANNGNVIRVSGNVEVTEAEISFKIPGWVTRRFVDEGGRVRTGDPIAVLESADLEEEVALRQGQVDEARAALDKLKNGFRPEEIAQALGAMQKAKAFLDQLQAGSRPEEIEAARAAVDEAKADAERLRIDHDRLAALFKRNQATVVEFETARAAHDAGKARLDGANQQFILARTGPRKEEIDQARGAYEQAKAAYELLKNGPRREDIDQAAARLDQADKSLAAARTRLGYAKLFSPMDGVVLSKNVEPGEYVAPGTAVVTIGNLADMWVRAYVNEPDLTRVVRGQPARVLADNYPGHFAGRVSFISPQAEFTPKTIETEKERVKLVYRIKVEVDNPGERLKPGMPVDVELDAAPPVATTDEHR